MLIKRPADIPSSEITDQKVYLNRRQFIRTAAATAAVAGGALGAERWLNAQQPAAHGRKLVTKKSPLSTSETPNTWEHVTTYNNYYEFGTDKDSPSNLAQKYLKPEPWTVSVEGECNKPAKYHLEDILKGQTLEDRIYRHRCVEAWSMVIPWDGFPLAKVVDLAQPKPEAKYVKFTSFFDPANCPAQRGNALPWPYTEGLTIAEARNELAFLATGLYGKPLRNQNGAPIRLVLPWKYGFKGAKSLVKIEFVAEQPKTTWNEMASNEYGFYANVNPNVDHPRWSQASERIIGGGFFSGKQPTLMFNGYEKQVAHLYAGMDLRKSF
jgi:sulfoxide reductase catalytic subunit YedY